MAPVTAGAIVCSEILFCAILGAVSLGPRRPMTQEDFGRRMHCVAGSGQELDDVAAQ